MDFMILFSIILILAVIYFNYNPTNITKNNTGVYKQDNIERFNKNNEPPLSTNSANNEFNFDELNNSIFGKETFNTKIQTNNTGNANGNFVEHDENFFNQEVLNNESVISSNINQKQAINLNNKDLKNYNVKDFLPVEENKKWFDTDFSQAKHNIKDDKLINVDRYVIGINTVGQSLKNASYDIRGTVANPKTTVSPWNNSTIEPDYNLKSLC